MRNTNYAFSGAMYEVQKTLEAFFGRCEVTITEDKPRHAVEVEVKYKTHNEVKWYRQVITDEMLAYGQDIERYLARDIPHRIVMDEDRVTTCELSEEEFVLKSIGILQKKVDRLKA